MNATLIALLIAYAIASYPITGWLCGVAGIVDEGGLYGHQHRSVAIVLAPVALLIVIAFIAAHASDRRRELADAEYQQRLAAIRVVERELQASTEKP